MSSIFEPSPYLLFFLFYKKFIYLELLALFALTRVIVGEGIARWPALVTLVLCLAGVATILAPVFGLNEGPVYASSARYLAEGGGMSALIIPSCVFLLCSITPRAKWRWIDWTHLLMLCILIGFWWYWG